MTDREKVDKLNEIGCNIISYSDTPTVSRFINSLYDRHFPWQPTSRPCFDKPAGTPILHGETV